MKKMNKTDLYNRLLGDYNDLVCTIAMKKALDEFFEQNVVIPKGKNRHPQADVLHEWVEGRVEGVFKYPYGSHRGIAKHIFTECSDFKIEEFKPSEPTHEWLWYDTKGNVLWLTDAEAVGSNMFKAEETKRERQ